MTAESNAEYCAAQVRKSDPDRYLAALALPESARDAALSIYAFNLEVSRAQDVTTELLLGQIRLQWWRDTITAAYEGRSVAHQVAQPLAEAIRRHNLTQGLFERMFDAREADLSAEPPETLDMLTKYADHTAGTLVELTLEVLGQRNDAVRQAGRRVGTAWALIGLMRAVPYHLRRSRIIVPAELLDRHGVDRRTLLEFRSSEGLSSAVREVVDCAVDTLGEARAEKSAIPVAALPAMALGPMTDSYARQLARCRYDPFHPRLGVRPPGRLLRLVVAQLRRRF